MNVREEIVLKRFSVTSLASARYAGISCTEGSVWITAGAGFSDIILKTGQSVTVLAKEMIVMEALTDSKVTVCLSTERLEEEAAVL